MKLRGLHCTGGRPVWRSLAVWELRPRADGAPEARSPEPSVWSEGAKKHFAHSQIGFRPMAQ
jgi:hypothetical protein